MDYPGKVITKNQVTPTQTSATGVWTLDDAAAAVKNNNWPVAGVPNPISRSLRFNSADSAYLDRTPGVAGNRRTFTLSFWIKQSVTSAVNDVWGNATDWLRIRSDADGKQLQFLRAAATDGVLTNDVLRDPSAWYHFVLSVDTTQATSTNRVKIYKNGVDATNTSGSTYPTQNYDYSINNTVAQYIGRGSSYSNGYMTEMYLIDGQALTPSSFGMTDPQTGAWEPIKYTGTYGTNGFYLNFKDATSTTTLGNDYSGNGNNYTPNNFSVTAGSGNDSLTDVPTPWIAYNTTGDVGGVFRGNYCTLNPLDGLNTAGALLGVFSNGNLDYSVSASAGNAPRMLAFSTIYFPSSGKWYAEFSNISNRSVGIISGSVNQAGVPLTKYITVTSGGRDFNDGSITSGGATSFTTSDVIGVAYDIDNATLKFYKNGTEFIAFGSVTTSVAYCFGSHHQSSSSSGTFLANFGQRPFANTPPSGFRSLCTTNLPNPTIGTSTTTQAGKYFDATLWTGNGTTQSITNSGGMQPDFLWVKSRSGTTANWLVNAVTGAGNGLISNSTAAEQSLGIVTSLDSSGFSVSTIGGTNLTTNGNAATFVGWQWNAGGSNATNTSGTITSTVRANTTAGFSIVTYTGNGSSSATVGHGLGVVPAMVITKGRSSATEWMVKHQSLPSGQNLILNQTLAASASTGFSQGVIANLSSSTTFGFTAGSSGVNNANQNGVTFVAYCFAEVAGYSAFGSYTGNASTDGPFVYTGFRPRFIFGKDSGGTNNWWIFDSVRDTYNVAGKILRPNLSDAELDSPPRVDLLSNGFKMRTVNLPNDATTYIYAAFAEFPFKFANAR